MGRFVEYLELDSKDNPVREWLKSNGFKETNSRDSFGYEREFPIIGVDRLADSDRARVKDLLVFVSITFKIIRVYAMTNRGFAGENSLIKELNLNYDEVTNVELFIEVIDTTMQECIEQYSS